MYIVIGVVITTAGRLVTEEIEIEKKRKKYKMKILCSSKIVPAVGRKV